MLTMKGRAILQAASGNQNNQNKAPENLKREISWSHKAARSGDFDIF